MAGQEKLQIVREIFAAWNAHAIEAFVKRLDQKTTWESDAFPAPFSGHEGARQFFKLYVGAPRPALGYRADSGCRPVRDRALAFDGDALRQTRRYSTHCSQSQPARLQHYGSQGYESGPYLGLFRQRAPTAADWCSAGELTSRSADRAPSSARERAEAQIREGHGSKRATQNDKGMSR